jgi:hypothetical protein
MKFFIMTIVCMTILATSGYTADIPNSGKPVQKSIPVFSVNNAFLSDLASRDPMRRDIFLSSKLNTMIEGTVNVLHVEEKAMFKRKYRITGNFSFNSVSLVCHIYSDNQDYSVLLSEGEKISFKGQLVMITPLGSKRDSYILDIILEDGAAVVE